MNFSLCLIIIIIVIIITSSLILLSLLFLLLYYVRLDTGFTILRNVHVLWVRAPLSKQYLKLQLFFWFPATRPIPLQYPVPRSFSFHEPGPFTTHRHHVALLKAFYSPASVFAHGGEDGTYFAGLLGFAHRHGSRESRGYILTPSLSGKKLLG